MKIWIAVLLASLATVAGAVLAAPAEASATTLCTGFSGCNSAGYSNFDWSSHNTTSYWGQYAIDDNGAGHNCTNYVAYRFSAVNVGKPSWLGHGNADSWGTWAPGITNSTPSVGAIAWWGSSSAYAAYGGHVSIVQQVNSDGSFLDSDDNWDGDFHWKHYFPGNSDWPTGFIHYNDGALGGGSTPPPPPPPPRYDPNLLRSSSFEDGMNGWGPGNGVISYSAYPSGHDGVAAKEGGSFGAWATSVSGRSLAQQVGVPVNAGDSYTASVWVRASSGTMRGQLNLWGLGNTDESSGTGFTVGTTWTMVSASLNAVRAHSALKLEIYGFTPGRDLYVDAATLVDAGLRSSSFEDGMNGWGPGNGVISYSAYPSGHDGVAAKEGGSFGAWATSVSGRSLAQQVGVPVNAGDSYTASVWVRASSGTMRGQLNLWGLGNSDESSGTGFTVGTTWTMVSASLNAVRAHSALKLEIYGFTPGRDLYVDAATLVDAGLRSSSFEDGMNGWGPGNGVISYSAYPSGHDGVAAKEGGSFGAWATSVSGRSLAQQVGVPVNAGDSYTASVWVRASSGTMRGQLNLWGLGNTDESSGTGFTVGTTWTMVSASLNAVRAHSALKLEIYGFTPGRDLYVDAATLGARNQSASQPGVVRVGTPLRGDRSATVFWTPAAPNGAPVTAYRVIASPGGETATVPGTARRATVQGLRNGITYSFTVYARNAVGAGARSAPSQSVVPAGRPATPSTPGVTVRRGAMVISWKSPSGNGARITSFQIRASNGVTKTVGAVNECTFRNLTRGARLAFRVRAANAVGWSSFSRWTNYLVVR